MSRKEIIGDFPLAVIPQQIRFYGNRDFLIAIPKTKIFLPEGQHSHGSYEFFIPSCDIDCLLENSRIVVPKNHVLAINPGQAHGFPAPESDIHFISIMVDRKFFNSALFSFIKEPVIFYKEAVFNSGRIDTLIRLFIEEIKYKQFGYEVILDKLAFQIILNIIRITNNSVFNRSCNTSRNKEKVIEKAIELIKLKFNSQLSVDDLAQELGLHPHYFIRLFKSYYGKTPHDYIIDLKIEKAMELLLLKNKNITDVCFLCGFTNQSHFSAVFKKKVGFTPSQYRNKYG